VTTLPDDIEKALDRFRESTKSVAASGDAHGRMAEDEEALRKLIATEVAARIEARNQLWMAWHVAEVRLEQLKSLQKTIDWDTKPAGQEVKTAADDAMTRFRVAKAELAELQLAERRGELRSQKACEAERAKLECKADLATPSEKRLSIECCHCGSLIALRLPVSVYELAATTHGFVERHRSCVKPVGGAP
jgi:hypothetical protein